MHSHEIKIMLNALFTHRKGHTWSGVHSPKLCPAEAKRRLLLGHWSRIILEFLVCILLYAHLNSSKKEAKILISYTAQSGSCLDSIVLPDLLKTTLTKEVSLCDLKANRKARVPSRAASRKKKQFLHIGKRSGFRKSHDTENLARQGTVCVVHLKRWHTWLPVLSKTPEHQVWTRGHGGGESKRTKLTIQWPSPHYPVTRAIFTYALHHLAWHNIWDRRALTNI